MNEKSALSDIGFIRLALLSEVLRRVERLPYPGEIQRCLDRRRSLLRLSELLYIVCGGEELPFFEPEETPNKNSAAAVKPETTADKAEPSPEAKAIIDFFGKAGVNIVRSAADRASVTGRVDTDLAKRSAVGGIAQTISMMMREDRNK